VNLLSSEPLVQFLEEIRAGKTEALCDLAAPEFGEGEDTSLQLLHWLQGEILSEPLIVLMHRMVAEFVCRNFLLSESGLNPLQPSEFSAAALVCAAFQNSQSSPNVQIACMELMDARGIQDAADILFIHLLLSPIFQQQDARKQIDTHWDLIQRSPLTRLIYLDRIADNPHAGGGLRVFLFRRSGPQRLPSLEWASLRLLTERKDFSALRPLLQWSLDALHRMPPEQQTLRTSAMESLVEALELHRRIPGLLRNPKPHHLEELLIEVSDA
jgi:hypothetical protein